MTGNNINLAALNELFSLSEELITNLIASPTKHPSIYKRNEQGDILYHEERDVFEGLTNLVSTHEYQASFIHMVQAIQRVIAKIYTEAGFREAKNNEQNYYVMQENGMKGKVTFSYGLTEGLFFIDRFSLTAFSNEQDVKTPLTEALKDREKLMAICFSVMNEMTPELIKAWGYAFLHKSAGEPSRQGNQPPAANPGKGPSFLN